MITRWNQRTNEQQESPEYVENFLNDLTDLFQTHGLVLSHEDGHGAFSVEPFDHATMTWIRQATFIPKD